ncbi:hypothetical protein Pcinc_003749 [Petrolisthes cinctipes]|uniref:Uncharacterized protein n=1 Tax=Petrolisthes cinctipes TaxID=88211 RepID=A0AAE1GG30_PETCI|nr:hypothetical protein Pcinc_003749 [Petrolisthes cinctipes]
MADSRSVAFKMPGIRLLIRLPSSRFEAVLPSLVRNTNNVDAVRVYRATACSARSPILTKGTTCSLSLSTSRSDTRTFPRHLLHVPPHHQNAKEWQEMWGHTRSTI